MSNAPELKRDPDGKQIQDILISLIDDEEEEVRERFDDESIIELSAQIKKHGLLQPILLRPVENRYKRVFGGRRLMATKMAGHTTIPARVIEKELDPGDVVIQQLIENRHKDLTPMEWSRGIAKAMKAKGMTASQVAVELGLSDTWVSNALARLKLPKWIQDLVEDGRIAGSAASQLARIEDAQQQAELARQHAEGKLTRDGLCGAVKAPRKVGLKEGQPGATRVTAVLGPGRSVTVSGAELDLESFIQSLEELIAKARRVRPRGIALGTFIKILRDEAKV